MLMSGHDALIAGRYRLVDRIGRGGMGVVWQAWDERLQRPVALKQLHPQVGLGGAEAQMAHDRATREARNTARLHHPHAVPVFDVVEHDGQPCLIMQYLPSTSLQTLLTDNGPLSPTEVARIGAEVASALAAAHRVGIVHRDVKPGNVLIAEDGSAKISDFGISHAEGDVSLTSTGMITGTPAYLAPEVARGGESSFASDVFSLGATLYTSLEGTPPFGTHPNPMALLHRVASGKVIPPRHGGPLTQLLRGMLAAAPQDRPTMEEVSTALTAVELNQAVTKKTSPWEGSAAATRAMDMTYPSTLPTTATGATVPLPVVGSPTAPPPPTDPGGSDDPPPHRAGARKAVVGAALVLTLAIAATYLLLGRGGVHNPTASPSIARPSSVGASTASSLTSTPSSAATPPTSAPPQSSAAASPAAAHQTTSAAPPTTTSGAPTGSQLAQAVTQYYGLLPGNTDGGWARLTQRYQATTAKDRQTYQAFWDAVQRVAVSNTTGLPPSTVETSLTYFFKDGRVTQERTSFGMVSDGGLLKIDSSKVLSSRPR